MHIIAVDDERLALWSLERMVCKAAPGAVVKAFRKGRDALLHAQQTTVDVAFLDIRMRDMHGLLLAEHLQSLHPRVNIIFVSASKECMDDAWKMHASGFVLKPARDEDIVEELAHLRYGKSEPILPALPGAGGPSEQVF